jgi:1-acyl-sn-glycerol-3-phosphate acyltransferase
MVELWYRCLYWFAARVYFARLAVVNPERRPEPGRPVLYLGLHRNGAIDGFVYHELLRRPVFLISTQLRRSWFSRLFFRGITVTRTKDEGSHEENEGALRQCVEHLSAGGQLFVFPEGTSSLGPRHLPFKSGGAWLILDYLESGGSPLQVIPVGIHYECPWAFRSKVEVVLGQPLSFQFAPGASRLARLKEVKRRIQAGLEEVGTNVASDDYQDQIQRLAYVTTLATPRSYFKSLKALEPSIPEPILKVAAGLEPELARCRLLAHQGVPLFPMGPLWLYGLALAIFGPLVLAAMLLNLPPLLAGWFAGKKFPDDRNVISLWRILIGIPVFALWGAAVILTLLLKGWLVYAGLYVLLTWLGLELYYRVKKLSVTVWNGLRYPKLKPCMLAFRQTVLEALPE